MYYPQSRKQKTSPYFLLKRKENKNGTSEVSTLKNKVFYGNKSVLVRGAPLGQEHTALRGRGSKNEPYRKRFWIFQNMNVAFLKFLPSDPLSREATAWCV